MGESATGTIGHHGRVTDVHWTWVDSEGHTRHKTVKSSIWKSDDIDWFAVTLEAGKTYGIARVGDPEGWATLPFPSYGTLGNSRIRGALHDDEGTLIDGTQFHGRPHQWGDLSLSEVKFTPEEDGTYYISVNADASYIVPLTYTVLVREIVDDFTAGTDTTGSVEVGGSVTGEIEWRGDQDWFAVTLEAGKTYRFDLKGVFTNDGTLKDPYLRGIHDAEGNLIEGTTNNDLEIGTLPGLNSRVHFTATEDGTYYVSAGSDGLPAGTYTLAVKEIVGDDFTAGTDTTGSVAVGGSATGNIDYVGDRDWFAVTLEAGKAYRFDLKGAGTGDRTLKDPYLRGIHDAEGSLIEDTTDDDGGEGLNSRVDFTATEGGTYYVSAGAIDYTVGTYTLSVSEADAM
ncbi:MAG: hypothetical protein F4213_18120 [Boseongicola sp. SB0677_bin_26]|nr:hypothetical protein [Boseongicola sp. SB0677_bin_26]